MPFTATQPHSHPGMRHQPPMPSGSMPSTTPSATPTPDAATSLFYLKPWFTFRDLVKPPHPIFPLSHPHTITTST